MSLTLAVALALAVDVRLFLLLEMEVSRARLLVGTSSSTSSSTSLLLGLLELLSASPSLSLLLLLLELLELSDELSDWTPMSILGSIRSAMAVKSGRNFCSMHFSKKTSFNKNSEFYNCQNQNKNAYLKFTIPLFSEFGSTTNRLMPNHRKILRRAIVSAKNNILQNADLIFI